MATFDPSSGLSLSETIIKAVDIISLLPSTNPFKKDEYILLHTSSSAPGLHKISLVAPPSPLVSRYSLARLPRHLSPEEVDISVIVSPASGTGKAGLYWTETLQPLLSMYGLNERSDTVPLGYKVHITTSKDMVYELAASLGAETEKQQSIIILSGDTLLFEFFNSLPAPARDGNQPIISVIPLGTGNALSVSISKSSAPLSTLLLGSPRKLPSFTARFSPGSEFVLPDSSGKAPLPADGVLKGSKVLSWGFHASLVADAETVELRKQGVERFKISARDNLLPQPHGYKGTVSIIPMGGKDWTPLSAEGGVTERDDHFYTLATMVSNLEETFCISPSSKPLAGTLHIVQFPVVPPEEVQRIMGMAYQGGKHAQDPQVRYEQIQGIRIEIAEVEEHWRRVCVDGAIVALPEGGWVEAKIGEGNVYVVYRE